MNRPNPLVDELTPEAKAELAAIFADLKLRFARIESGRRLNAERHRIGTVPMYRLTGRRGW